MLEKAYSFDLRKTENIKRIRIRIRIRNYLINFQMASTFCVCFFYLINFLLCLELLLSLALISLSFNNFLPNRHNELELNHIMN